MSDEPLALLGGLSAQSFLSEYWQKKPLLVRNALPNFECLISPDELAGLSLEESVESRIIIERFDNKDWVLEQGPFEATRYEALENLHWTLLIQQLDAWSDDVNSLKSHFNFLPNWRIDDIMASFAPRGGSVGPHFDFYDVFLIQAMGERTWHLGQHCDATTATEAGTSLSILKEFEHRQQWTLSPGDMLYVPPQLAHHGIAENDCITLSVGFRAPRRLELLSDFADFMNETSTHHNNPFFSDAGRSFAEHPGEVSSDDKAQLKQMMSAALTDPLFDQWLGEYLSRPKNDETIQPELDRFDETDLQEAAQNNATLIKNEGSRFIYINTPQKLTLFVDGLSFDLESGFLTFVQTLCTEETFAAQSLLQNFNTISVSRVLCALIEQGSLNVET